MSMQEDKRRMKWQTDFDIFADIFHTFILDGNIDDIQPYIKEDGKVEYVKLDEYFTYVLNEDRANNKKCVIIYDPTENDGLRFDIHSPYEMVPAEQDPDEEEPDEPAEERHYSDALAQHFWDIVEDDELQEHLIQHNAGGVTLDVSRMHYAITERERMNRPHIPQRIRSFLLGNNQSSESTGYVFIMKMTSRLLSHTGSSNGLSEDELMLFRQLLNISQSIQQHSEHKLIILANKATDLPMWFTDEVANPYIKKITIEKPSDINKDAFFDELVEEGIFGAEFNQRYREAIALRQGETLPYGETETQAEKKIKRKFRALVNDFSMNMLQYYRNYLEHDHKIDSPDQLGYSIASFRSGVVVNPWKQEDKVRNILNITNVVKQKIKGQDQALDVVQQILTRAAIGLGRVGNPNAPRVVLFLAGPTGTGKTEICKQLAEAIFGSEDRMVRFDMSEYGQEHADQKLFGAPPGYVGYEEGGKLTNAIKKEPFSLVLFDEIEKAHSSIMDKFLQVLSDGRLTDGHGETVSFTDAIIAFTSNAGVCSPTPQNDQEAERIKKAMGNQTPPSEEINMEAVIRMENEGVSADDIYARVSDFFRYNVKHYFCCDLGRPELYGRIENALVYYNYIGKDSVETICKANIKSLLEAATDEYGLQPDGDGYTPEVLAKIVEYCQAEEVRSMGARGIGNAVNKLFEGSISNYIKPYIWGENGKSRNDLRGKVCKCRLAETCDGKVKADDILWEN